MEKTIINPQEKCRKAKSPKNDGESSSTKSFWAFLDLFVEKFYKCLPGIVFCFYSAILVFLFYRFTSVAEIRGVTFDVTAKHYWIQLDEFKPCWYSPYDMSQVRVVFDPSQVPAFFTLKRDLYRYETIHFDNNRNAEVVFSSFSIDPDWMTKNEIHYESWEKLTKLKEEGLSFYVTYPEMRAKQMTRITILTVLMSLAFQKAIEKTVVFLRDYLMQLKKKLEKKMSGEKA